MSLANREAFLKPIELDIVEIETRVGKVRMRELSGSRLTELKDWTRPNGKECDTRKSQSFLKLLTMTIVDSSDEPFLTEDDFEVIESYPRKLREKLITTAAKLNGFIEKDDEVTEDLRGKSSS